MIFELNHWGSAFSEMGKRLETSFNDRVIAKHSADEILAIFEFEQSIMWIAFFARRLFDEASMAAESDGVFSPKRPPIEAILEISKKCIDLPHSIGPKFQLNSSYSVGYWKLCDEIIHSGMLNLGWPSPTEEDGFFVSSDRNSARRILFVPISALQELTDNICALSLSDWSK